MKVLVFLGPPGVGKGTQARLLEEKYHFKRISTGDILRKEIDEKTPLGKEAQEYVRAGQLVPDELIMKIIQKNLEGIERWDGIVFDGFPRNENQAIFLKEILKKYSLKVDYVIYFNLPLELAVKRLQGRIICERCQENYHVEFKRPKKEGICDKCQGKLLKRQDDKEDVVEERVRVYMRETQPLLDFYQKEGVLVKIESSKNIKEIFNEILKICRL